MQGKQPTLRRNAPAKLTVIPSHLFLPTRLIVQRQETCSRRFLQGGGVHPGFAKAVMYGHLHSFPRKVQTVIATGDYTASAVVCMLSDSRGGGTKDKARDALTADGCATQTNASPDGRVT